MTVNRPNIFDYATKELSQDAIICWLLKCCHSDNHTYKSIGVDFIKFILDNENISTNDIELEKNSPYAQYHHMDVYANIRVRGTNIPVIFEDKTNTFLHGGQEEQYIEKVTRWKDDNGWDNIRFIFFKTGFVFDWQKVEIEELKKKSNAIVKTVYIDDMINFIEKYKEKDLLLADYCQYLRERQLNLMDSVESKCNRYFREIFGDTGWFKYNYQEWASRDFGYIEDKSQREENRIWYGIRTGWRKNGKEYSYSIFIQQYRNEKSIYGNAEKIKQLTEQRYIITEEAREICNMVFKKIENDLSEKITLENNTKNRMPSQNILFKLFINEENEDKVCSFFREFMKGFNLLAKEKYEDKYYIC